MTKEQILNWSADQQLLAQIAPNTTNRYGAIIFQKEPIKYFTAKFSEEDKIEIISKFDEKFAKILEIVDLFREEKDIIKKDNYGYYKTVSLVGWVKRNKAQDFIDTTYRYGEIYNYRNVNGYNFFLTSLDDDKKRTDFINQIFVLTIIKLREKELEYWFDHDEYTLLKRRWENEHITNFGVPITFCSSGQILIRDTEGEDREREITIDELKQLLEMNDKLKAYIQQLTDECNIRF